MLGFVAFLLIALALLVLLLTSLAVHAALHPPRHSAGYAVARSLAIDPGEMKLAHEAWTLERPHGVTLPVWEIAGSADGAGVMHSRTVILIHGWGQSMIDMLPEAAWWSQRAARIVLYDQRGHGDAAGDVARMADARDRDDLIALMERLGDGAVLLAGYSLGATIAIHAAAAVHERHTVHAIIGYGVAPRFMTSLKGRLRLRGYPVFIASLMQLALRLRGITSLNAADALANVRCPILLLHGGDDLVVPLEHVRSLASAHDHVTLHIVDGGRHADLNISGGARVAKIIDAFLAET